MLPETKASTFPICLLLIISIPSKFRLFLTPCYTQMKCNQILLETWQKQKLLGAQTIFCAHFQRIITFTYPYLTTGGNPIIPAKSVIGLEKTETVMANFSPLFAGEAEFP